MYQQQQQSNYSGNGWQAGSTVDIKQENRPTGYSSYSGAAVKPAGEDMCKLFIGGLSRITSDESLKQYYSQFGNVVDCIVMRDEGNVSRGFGFVTLSSIQEVDYAMNTRPHIIDEKQVDPKRAIPRDRSKATAPIAINTSRLYVANVNPEHTDEDFENYFKNYGNIIKVDIVRDQVTKAPRGFAFVTFDDHDAVDKCVLEGSHMIKNFRCDVKKALAKQDMARSHQLAVMRSMPMSRGTHRSSPYSTGRSMGVNSGGYVGGYGAMNRAPGGWPPMSGYNAAAIPASNGVTPQWGQGYNAFVARQATGGWNNVGPQQMWPQQQQQQQGPAYQNNYYSNPAGGWNNASVPTSSVNSSQMGRLPQVKISPGRVRTSQGNSFGVNNQFSR